MKLSIIPILFALAFLLVPPMTSFADITTTELYSCDNPQDSFPAPSRKRINQIDKTDGTIISSQTIAVELSEGAYVGCLGLATDPTDGQMYMIAKDDESNRYLVTLDPTTGIATEVAKFTKTGGSNWNARMIAFNSAGQMFTGNSAFGDPTGKNIFKVSKTTGIVDSNNLFCDFGVYTKPPPTDPSEQYPFITLNYDTGNMFFIDGTGEDIYFGVVDETGAGGSCEVTSLPSTRGSLANFQQGLAYDTGTGDYFILDNQGNPHAFLQMTDTGVITDLGVGHDGIQKGLTFAITVTPSDAVAPVISATSNEPITLIQDSSFDAFEFVDCNDDVDGAIVPNGDFATDGGITIDTSTRGSQLQDYTCTDSADNNTLETIQYIIKKKSSSGGGGSSSGSSSIAQLSDIPVLTFQDRDPRMIEPPTERRSIGDLFASLFADRLNPTENIPQAQSVFNSGQSSGSPATDRSSPVADFFRNLFSSWFG